MDNSIRDSIRAKYELVSGKLKYSAVFVVFVDDLGNTIFSMKHTEIKSLEFIEKEKSSFIIIDLGLNKRQIEVESAEGKRFFDEFEKTNSICKAAGSQSGTYIKFFSGTNNKKIAVIGLVVLCVLIGVGFIQFANKFVPEETTIEESSNEESNYYNYYYKNYELGKWDTCDFCGRKNMPVGALFDADGNYLGDICMPDIIENNIPERK